MSFLCLFVASDCCRINSSVGNITNLEVLQILQENKAQNMEKWKGMKKDLHQSLTVEEQVGSCCLGVAC